MAQQSTQNRPALTRVSFAAPPNWEDHSALTFVAPADDGFRANVVVTSDVFEGSSAADHVKRQVAVLQQETEGFAVLRESAASMGGHAGHAVEFRFIAHEQQLRQRQVHVVVDNRLYTVSATHLDADFERVRPQFDAVVASFQLD